MKKRIISVLMIVCLMLGGVPMSFQSAIAAENSAGQPALQLRYDEPATDWETEGLPLGNGFLGATVYGGVEQDKILLNEHTLWSGGPGANADYDGGHNEKTAQENYENLAYARDELQKNMTEFAENSSSYIDEDGNVVSENYPAMSDELTAAINALKGEKTNFGAYQELGKVLVTEASAAKLLKVTTNCNTNNNIDVLVDGLIGTSASSWFSAGGNKWGTNSVMPAEITLQYSAAKPIASYTVSLAFDTMKHGRNPETLAFYGSVNATDWVQLDYRTNVGWTQEGETKTFDLECAVAYPYYKFSFIENAGTDNCGSASHAAVPAWGIGLSEVAVGDAEPSMTGVTVNNCKDTTNLMNMFDGSADTKWYSSNGAASVASSTTFPFDLVMKYNVPYTISGYSLTNGGDSVATGRDPTAWDLYGSNDGTTWTLLDQKTGASFGGNKATLSYALASPVSFRQYKLTFKERVPLVKTYGIQLSEVTLIPVESFPQFHTNNDAKTDSQKVASLYDNDPSTKFYVLGGHAGATVVDYPVWTQVSGEFPLEFASYSIVSGEDVPARDPKDWELLGSNDGVNWTVLDTQKDQVFSERRENKTFTLAQAAYYRFIRWNIKETAGKAPQASDLILLDAAGNAITFENSAVRVEVAENYSRVLDLNNATASVNYTLSGVQHEREYFVSNPGNVMAVRYTVKDGTLNKRISMDTAQTAATVTYEGNIVTITGRPADHKENLDHLKFAGQIEVVTDGTTTADQGGVLVQDASEIILYVAAGTNYQQCTDDTFDYFTDEDPLVAVAARIAAAKEKGYTALKNDHVVDYTELFDRVQLDLGGNSDKTVNALLDGSLAATNTPEENRYLEMLYYQYGRYLLISSSREGSLPANLQGIWAAGTTPAWNSDYHTNINVQMNYWLAESTNLAECHQPLMDYINAQVARGEETAQHYHYTLDAEGNYQPARGWTAYHENNVWGNTSPGTSSAFFFPVGAAWLCHHIWEQYEFSQDREQLAENFDALLGAAIFWVDNLVVDERDGTLVVSPSYSPEHGPYSLGCTQDQAIVRELFQNTLQAAEVLGIETAEIAEIRAAYEKLSGFHIGKAGQFQEWKDEVTIDITGDNHHRHVNHLYALFPGNLVIAGRSEQDDAYLDAMKTTLNTRGIADGVGWSKAWKINFLARMHEGDQAATLLTDLLSKSTYDNLFDACFENRVLFQIDGNFGAVSGMTEMLLQSQGDAIELLPALPTVWKTGSVSGLRARGNVEVDMAWSNGNVTTATLAVGTADEALQVKGNYISKATVTDSTGAKVETTVLDTDTIEFAAEADEIYTLTFEQQTVDYSVLEGKNALYVGDSITYGSMDDSSNRLSWGGRIANAYNMTYVNAGIRSNPFSSYGSNAANWGRIVTQLLNHADEDFDYVMIHGGINDAYGNTPVGKISSSFDPDDFDVRTYSGALEQTFSTAIELYGDTAAIGYLMNFRVPGYSRVDDTLMREYILAAEKICEKWGVAFYNMYDDTALNEALKVNTKTYLPDTLHPNKEGYDIIAPYIAEFMAGMSVHNSASYEAGWAPVLQNDAAALEAKYFTAESFSAFNDAIANADDCDALIAAAKLLVQSEVYPSVSIAGNYYYGGLEKLSVSTAEDFVAFAERVNNGRMTASQTVLQTADIDMAEYPNVRVGEGIRFEGTYDGQNHTIENYSITDGANNTAMFQNLCGTVKNLKVKNASVHGNTYSAVVVSNAYGTAALIENVHVNGSAFIKSGNSTGAGILLAQGTNNNVYFTVKNCTVSGCSITVSPTSTSYNVGFVVGKSRNGGGLIENCYAWDNTFELTTDATLYSVAGIMGEAVNMTIRNCGAYDNTYTGTNLINLGGVVGQGIGETFVMQNCYTDTVAVGKVVATASTVENNYEAQTAADIESGKLAYTLKDSGDWVQKNMPMVAEGSEPFAVTLVTENETKVLYTNEKGILIGEVPEAFAWKMGETLIPVDELATAVFDADATLTAGYLPGDLNGNGTADTADATLLLQYLVGKDVEFKGDADLNGDGNVSIYDAVLLLRSLSA
ncbi:MAG: glycoside hydrolase N-terminal domain-containing protein [Clostridia bacterium]|nr:glycoside hydrolase N-terminal domain-containing protein [Clostridia bacterium]